MCWLCISEDHKIKTVNENQLVLHLTISALLATPSTIQVCYSARVGCGVLWSTRLSVREHSSGTAGLSAWNFVCRSPVTIAQSSSGGVVIWYVLLVLWMTSHLAITDTTPKRGGYTVQRWPWAVWQYQGESDVYECLFGFDWFFTVSDVDSEIEISVKELKQRVTDRRRGTRRERRRRMA